MTLFDACVVGLNVLPPIFGAVMYLEESGRVPRQRLLTSLIALGYVTCIFGAPSALLLSLLCGIVTGLLGNYAAKAVCEGCAAPLRIARSIFRKR